jgi:glucose-1-phosphate cytidylyltransferase
MELNKLQVVILCGGKGTRIRNFKKNISKPLIKINRITILERIIRVYSGQGFKNFLILTGYKAHQYSNFKIQDLNIKILFTGVNSGTAQRIYKAKKFLYKKDFFLTYGDTIGDFSIKKVEDIVNKKNFIVSLCTYSFFLNKGILKIKKNKFLKSFYEKNHKFYFNAGYYYVKKFFFNYLDKSHVSLEEEILPYLAKKNKIVISQELKYWYPVDNKNDFSLAKRFFI